MDTLLVKIPKRTEPATTLASSFSVEEQQLAESIRRVLTALPDLGMPFVVNAGTWQAASGATLLWSSSVPERGATLVHSYRTEAGGVLLFGEVMNASAPAESVWRCFLSSGALGVRELDGCFSAIIWNAQSGDVDVVADLIGQRALRFMDAQDGAWLSPHDTNLVACGAASVRFDPISAYSCLVVENSLQAKPLLSDVQGLEGNDWLRVPFGRSFERRRLPKLDLSQRIAAKDVQAQRRCRGTVAEQLVTSTQACVAQGQAIRCELTAGIDSRATLACLLGAGAAPHTTAVTSGGKNSLDVLTARKLARLAGVPHERLPDASSQPDHFLKNLTLRAFATNGETDAKRATGALPTWNPDGPVRVEGSSGEIFRGFFYPYFGATGIAPDHCDRLVDGLLTRRCRRFAKTPVADPNIRTALRARMLECFLEYRDLSKNGNDMLDLFYLFERTAHWSAHVRRASWTTSRNVFLVPSAIRQSYQMPAPLGFWVGVHAEMIQRFIPAAKWTLINGVRPIQLEGPGRSRMVARLGLTVARAGVDRVRKKLSAGAASTYDAHAELFAGPLFPLLQELLNSTDSVTSLALGSQGTERILNEHRRQKNHLALLGYAATLDVYRALLLRVRP